MAVLLLKLSQRLCVSILLCSLLACSGGSGGGGTDPQVDNANTVVTDYVYSGASPASTEIQNFKLAFFDNLVGSDRCGQCHTEGGTGTTYFVNREDVNLAWQAAKTVVNLTDPASSTVVERVSSGHNCWLGAGQEASCAATMIAYIERWAQGASQSVSSVMLLPRNPASADGAQILPNDLSALNTLAPAFDITASGELLHILNTHCSGCHSDTAIPDLQRSPYFASNDSDVAYSALVDSGKVNLATPINSRLVLRLSQDSHNCWGLPGDPVDCGASATIMTDAITRLSDQVPIVTVDSRLVISLSQGLERDGIVATSGGRYETDVIAKWEFREGTGMTVADTSGVQPEIPLTLSGGFEWLGGWGVRFTGGKAQGGTTSSQKLKALLTATGEYSIEAWVAPNNVTQENAWIFGYSGGDNSRNLLVTQSLYNYESYNRSTVSLGDGSGGEALSTDDGDELAQATLQHLVVTFDPVNGRKIYVNGADSGVVDPLGAGLLASWNDSFAVTIGNSVSLNRDWLGATRMLAVHNRSLTLEQIQQNNDIGVGQKYYLLFSVAEILGSAQEGNCYSIDSNNIRTNYCYIGFEVSEYDDTSYLFNEPFFVNINPDPQPLSFSLEGIHIGINGQLATVGQGFVNIRATIDSVNFTELGQSLSPMGSIIPKQNGASNDVFFLAFDTIDGNADSIPASTAKPYSFSLSGSEQYSDLAFKTFDAINQSFSVVTGVSSASNVASNITGKTIPEVYTSLRQQLPSVADFQAYFSSHQMAITQLAAAYCDALVQDQALRDALFPDFNFSFNVTTDSQLATGSSYWENFIIDPLIDRFLNTGLYASEPMTSALTGLKSALSLLITDNRDLKPYVYDGSNYISTPDGKNDGLRYCDNNQACPNSRTNEVVKATCTALLASAALQIN